ncbi:Uncharacterised protein [Mycobacteroides abscessus subsp. abscessus]|uniref:Uncharacterized protein n=1 Tax=Mycobacteroides abscessus subsp. massiliense TaxID=1962118 RepID=A0A4D8RPA8_9MYCO|nr:hypothetical protein [Mycobacteroides abscessus]QCO28931.1 hypothetical protein CFE69_23580 [Mycobacteroides abscessus subsp. massiliense]SHY28422.1 Uncharacterised protein [Mycobacteroides abscessus subsp. abscessus]SID71668.1 Uncharacterised protein [Mycobacteroides abscessus subsp. abscessus]SKL79346.1 Uncharacterised protein [Mycobacteroides abscessus subsp. massiliense]SKM16942.1 Uncharacterised protein [Mycobacteroides abscessus subsp. massiliense]
MTSRIRQVQLRHVERHARKAIGNRLGYAARDAVITVVREEHGRVMLHVNSGGNAIVAEQRLRSRGYRVEYKQHVPGVYGVQLLVGAAQESVQESYN